MVRDHVSFGYRIRKTREGWRWAAFGPGGEVEQEGCAPSKVVAAACVIRAIARSSGPGEVPRAA